MYVSVLSILFLYAAADRCIDITVFKKHHALAPENIILITNDDDQSIKDVLNTFDSVRPTPDICPGGVRGLIEASKLFPEKYIINLNVPDFYKFNYNYVTQYLIYGGDRNVSEHKVEACIVDFKNTDLVNISCNEKSVQTFAYPTVKLMSKHVKKNPTLYNFVNNYPSGEVKTIRIDTSSGMIILVCDIDARFHDSSFNTDGSTKIAIKHTSNCEEEAMKYQNNLLAVLALNPFEKDNNILAPIILYQHFCYNEHITKSDNYVILTTCDGYKYAFLEFLKHSNWLRVAIVSDNTQYSEKFERDMTELFETNEFTYTVVRCVKTAETDCSFVQALQLLKNSAARVFIANIDKTNADNLHKDVSDVWSEGNKMSSWILRDFVLNDYEQKMGDIYTVPFELSRHDMYLNIEHAYKEVNKTISQLGKPFYRQLTHALQNRGNHIASVCVQNSNYETIMRMAVNNKKVNIVSSEKYNPRNDMDSCSVRKRNFHYPCDDNNLLTILVILVVVAACGLITVLLTSHLDNAGRRYTNLS